jgi:hypothetical protein
VVKLLRTDTTLDLSQKARVVRIHSGWGGDYIPATHVRTDQVDYVSRVFVSEEVEAR